MKEISVTVNKKGIKASNAPEWVNRNVQLAFLALLEITQDSPSKIARGKAKAVYEGEEMTWSIDEGTLMAMEDMRLKRYD